MEETMIWFLRPIGMKKEFSLRKWEQVNWESFGNPNRRYTLSSLHKVMREGNILYYRIILSSRLCRMHCRFYKGDFCWQKEGNYLYILHFYRFFWIKKWSWWKYLIWMNFQLSILWLMFLKINLFHHTCQT